MTQITSPINLDATQQRIAVAMEQMAQQTTLIAQGKADKVSNPTNGNFAGIDGNGNLTDSGKKPGDYYTKTEIQAMTRNARLTDFDLAVLKQAVADGNLEKYGLKPGDQKTFTGGGYANDRTYVIAGLNPMKGTTTPYRVTTNHVGLIVIPHTTHAWNADGKTTKVEGGHDAGYMNSELHAYLKSDILPMCNTDLGAANLIGHSKLLTNTVNANGYNRFGEATGCSSNWTWEADCKICALSEVQVYGAAIWSSSGYDTGEACRQLDVFQRYSHTEIFGGEYPWLRDVVSASHAAIAGNAGNALRSTASIASYVAALILFH